MSMSRQSAIAHVVATCISSYTSYNKPSFSNALIKSCYPHYRDHYKSLDAVRADLAVEYRRQETVRWTRRVNRYDNTQPVGNYQRKRSDVLVARQRLASDAIQWTHLTSAASKTFRGNGFYDYYDGTYIYEPGEDDEGYWEKYGKRSYWRKKITARYVTQSAFIEGQGIVETGRYELESFRGEWYAKAIRSLSGIEPAPAQIECYKVVAIRDDGSFASVYKNSFTYRLGEVCSDKINTRGPICSSGGIFVHATIEDATKQKFPDESENLDLPRALLRGVCYGRKHIDEKIAAEHFLPTVFVGKL